MPLQRSGGWLESVKTIVYAALIAVGIRTVAFEPFNIPSGSMIPSLLVGDYLFVSKFSYGYSRHSMPFSPNLFEGRIFASPPKRGDVAVFKLPRDGSTDYIKRIIGLPGDRVQMRSGILHLNGTPVRRELLGPFTVEGDGPRITVNSYRPLMARQLWRMTSLKPQTMRPWIIRRNSACLRAMFSPWAITGTIVWIAAR